MILINNSDELFILIKSMTMSEKRYFKLASKRFIGEKNNYIRIFEVIEKQKVYNEGAIIKQFRDKKFTKQFAVVKNYLYKLILKAMRGYNGTTSIDVELKGMLIDIDFLYYKGLYAQSSKVLKKAKQFAYQYEQYAGILELLEKERLLNLQRGEDILSMETKNDLFVTEKKDVLNKINNIEDYQIIQDRLLLYSRKVGINKPKDEVGCHELINQPLLKDEQLAITSKSKRLFFNSNAQLYSLIENFPASYEYRKKLLDFINSHPEQLKAHPEIYVTAYINIILTCCEQKKYKEAISHIDKLRKFKVNYEELNVKIFQTGYLHELLILENIGQYEKAVTIIPEIEKGLKVYKKKINRIYEIIFYYNIACIYIGAGKYNDALTWNNKLLNDMEADIRHDVLSHARIINLIIHFELGN